MHIALDPSPVKCSCSGHSVFRLVSFMESLILSPYAFISPISLFSTTALFLSSSLVVPSIRLRAPLLFSIPHLLSHLNNNIFSVFKLDTDHLSHTMPCDVAGRTLSLDPLDSLFPTSHFSSCVVYIVALSDSNLINTLCPASSKDRQLWPFSLSLSLLVCVHMLNDLF